MRNAASKLRLLLLLASPPLLQCGVAPSEGIPAPYADETFVQESQKLSQLGVERIIPVRFIVLGPCPNVTLNQAGFSQAIREANNIWLTAGVQFSLARFDSYNTPKFNNLSTVNTWTWAQIWQELAPINPGIITAQLFQGQSLDAENWTHLVSAKLSSTQVRVWVPCSDASGVGGHSAFPWNQNGPSWASDNSQYIHITASQIADYTASPGAGHKNTTFAHEVGHYLGLTHNWDIATLDPNHLSSSGDGFFYDMFYAIDSGAIRTFSSPTDLATYDPTGTKRRPKHGGAGAGGVFPPAPGLCVMNDGSTGDVTCNWTVQNVSTSANPSLIYPIGFVHQGGEAFGNNLMGYLQGPDPSGAWQQLQGLGPTQVARVKETLRGGPGKRELLGRGEINLSANRSAFSPRLDFDGDGKRDLAFWRHSDKSCHIVRSTDGTELVITIPQADVLQDDVPVPGNFDFDSKTDCAIYRRGSTPNTAVWYWAQSTNNYQVTSASFGTAGDIPIPDTRLPAAVGHGLFAVYRPSSGQYFWLESTQGYRTVTFGQPGDEIALADYDGDGFTDLANWTPAGQQSVFFISRSTQNFGSWTSFNFGTSTDVPIGPVRHNNDNFLDYAIWRPSSGTWWYLMNPGQAGGGWVESEQWGTSSDVPLGGYDWDLDGKSDAVVYRPATSSSSGARTLIVLKSNGGWFGMQVGAGGDIPFVSEDRDGDSKPEFWLYRPDTATYFINWSTTEYGTFDQYSFGRFMDIPF